MDTQGPEKSGFPESRPLPNRGSVLRFDAAHRSASATLDTGADSRRVPDSAPDQPTDSHPEIAQIQSHAAQLHEQLTDRLRELDRRESLLNTRAAEAENEVRRVQLVVSEREAAVRTLENKLQARCAELDGREARVAADEAVCREMREQTQRDAEVRQHELDEIRRESERLDLQRGRLQDESAAAKAVLETQRADLQQCEAACQQRERLLDAAALAVERQSAEIRRHAEEIRQQREQLDALASRQQSDWAAHQREREQRLDERQQELELEAHSLQQRQAALDALQRDVARLHGESLEMRLVTEQLRIHLLEEASDPELTKSINQLRARLAEEQRRTEATLDAKRDEIQHAAVRLKKRRQDLETRRDQLQAWFQQRQADLEEQTLTLAAREEQLQQKHWDLWQQRETWNQQRHRLEQQIRDLTLQLQRSTRRAA
jgi:chromosome segregation ATPase